MADLSQLIGLGGSGRINRQVFTSSGTFTPSTKLLKRGGWVWAHLIGGGGQGGANRISATPSPGGGGGAGCDAWFLVQVAGPTAVTIAAGGGSTTFGAATAQPGLQPDQPLDGAAAGGRSGGGYGGDGGSGFGSIGGKGGRTTMAGYGTGGDGGNASASVLNPGTSGLGGYAELVWEE